MQRCCCPGLLAALREQTQALTLQAAAIDRLAESNEALVDALYQEEGDQAGPTSPHL